MNSFFRAMLPVWSPREAAKRTSVLLAMTLSVAGVARADPPAPDVHIVDVDTLDQNGRALSFARDVIGDRIVVVNFIYTRCTTLCPLSSAIFERLQTLLMGSNGAHARLVSISLDPASDTPARLKEFAQKFDVGPDWLWITGDVTNVEAALKGMGGSQSDFREHGALTLVGDAKHGRWTQFNSLAGPEKLYAEVERLQSKRAPPATAR